MDSTDLRLIFVLGLMALAIGIALVAWAVDWLVTRGRAHRQRAIERVTRSAPRGARTEASRPTRRPLARRAQ
jgi:hypothetical protein